MFLEMSDFKAVIVGSLCSILGTAFTGTLIDALTAFIFGGIGALGGWSVNQLIKYIQNKRGKKKV